MQHTPRYCTGSGHAFPVSLWLRLRRAVSRAIPYLSRAVAENRPKKDGSRHVTAAHTLMARRENRPQA
jgi:hypothetical protein